MSSKKSSAQKREAQERAAAIVAAQKATARRRTLLLQGGIGVVVVAVVLLLTVVLLQRSDSEPAKATPPAVDAQGRFVVGAADAPVTVEVVEDFQCPVCKAFEEQAGDLLRGYQDGDEVKVAYRPIAFLDRASSTEYSSRALNAAACVMADGEDVWTAYHRILFETQPEEGGSGLTDAQLVSMAVEAGADEEKVTSCVEDGTYRDWAEKTTQQAADDGVDGTPTVYVDGEKVDDPGVESIEAAVRAAS